MGLRACGIFLEQGSNLCPLHWQEILNHWTTREDWGRHSYYSHFTDEDLEAPGFLLCFPQAPVWFSSSGRGCSTLSPSHGISRSSWLFASLEQWAPSGQGSTCLPHREPLVLGTKVAWSRHSRNVFEWMNGHVLRASLAVHEEVSQSVCREGGSILWVSLQCPLSRGVSQKPAPLFNMCLLLFSR